MMNLANALNLPNAPQAFLRQTETRDTRILVQEYAEYMLRSAGTWRLPVDIDRLIEHHGFRLRVELLSDGDSKQRGFLMGNRMVINGDDPAGVQNYSKAHEFVEGLFAALRAEVPGRYTRGEMEQLWRHKEFWCDWGAAEIMLPGALFFPVVRSRRVRLSYGFQWARDCRLSVTPIVRRMVEADVSPCIFVLAQEGTLRWSQPMLSNQGSSVYHVPPWRSSADLRVWRQWNSPSAGKCFAPSETIPPSTSIYRALQKGLRGSIFGEIDACNEVLDFQQIKGRFHVETTLVRMRNTPTVMALIHLGR